VLLPQGRLPDSAAAAALAGDFDISDADGLLQTAFASASSASVVDATPARGLGGGRSFGGGCRGVPRRYCPLRLAAAAPE